VSCQYDERDKSLLCKTPKFEEFEGQQHPSLKWPCNCVISVTMDGIHYSECEQAFKIYSNDLFLTSINPKSGSITGGTTLTMLVNLDEATASAIQNLRIGFQPKKNMASESSKNTIVEGNSHRLEQQRSYQSLHESHKSSVRGSHSILQGYEHQNDLRYEDPMAAWTWTEAVYENGTVTCRVPALEHAAD